MTLIRHKQPIISNVLPHNANRRFLKTNAASQRGGGDYPANLAFVALDGAPTVQKGTGGLTCTHADTLYALNESTGYYEAFGPNIPVWVNGWLHYYPAATNSQVQSSDLTNVEWTATDITATQDQQGLDGGANGATHLVHTGAGVGSSVYANVVTAAQGEHCLAVWIKRLAGTGIIDVSIDGGSSFINITSQLVQDEWVKVTYSQSLVTNPQLGIGIATIGDEIAVGNFELHLDRTDVEVRGLGPIFTTTAAVSVEQTVYAFDAANTAADNFVYYMELDGTDGAAGAPAINKPLLVLGGVQVTWAFREDNGPSLGQVSNAAGAYAGYNSIAGGQGGMKHAITAAEDTVALNIDGAYDPVLGDAALAAPWATEGMSIFNSPLQPTVSLFKDYRIRNLRRYDAEDYADGKAIIDALMV